MPTHRDAVRTICDRCIEMQWLHAAKREYGDARPLNSRGESLPAERASIGVRRCRKHWPHDDKIDIERARTRDLRARMA